MRKGGSELFAHLRAAPLAVPQLLGVYTPPARNQALFNSCACHVQWLALFPQSTPSRRSLCRFFPRITSYACYDHAPSTSSLGAFPLRRQRAQPRYTPALDSPPEINQPYHSPRTSHLNSRSPLGRALLPRPSFLSRRTPQPSTPTNQHRYRRQLPDLPGPRPLKIRDLFPFQFPRPDLSKCATSARPRPSAQPSNIRDLTFQNARPVIGSAHTSWYVPLSSPAGHRSLHEQDSE